MPDLTDNVNYFNDEPVEQEEQRPVPMWETTSEAEAFEAPAVEPAPFIQDRSIIPAIQNNDTLLLDFPALAANINTARSQGLDDSEIRQMLAENEMSNGYQMSSEELDKLYGRTKETRTWSDRVYERQGVEEIAKLTGLKADDIRERNLVADKLGLSRSTMLDNDVYKAARDQVRVIDDFVTAGVDAAKAVSLNQQAARLVWSTMGRDMTAEEQAQLDALNKEIAKYSNVVYTSMASDITASTANLVAQQAYGVMTGAKWLPAYVAASGAANLAYGAATGAMLNPLGAGAVAVKSFAEGASMTALHGAFENSTMLEAAGIYQDLLQIEGINKTVAMNIARAGGAINGAIEVGNLATMFKVLPGMKKFGDFMGQFLKGGAGQAIKDGGGVRTLLAAPSIRGAIIEGLKNYAEGVKSETMEEIQQAFVSILARELTTRVYGQDGKSFKDCVKELMAEGTAALAQMAKGMAPGALINTVSASYHANRAARAARTGGPVLQGQRTELTGGNKARYDAVQQSLQRQNARVDVQQDLKTTSGTAPEGEGRQGPAAEAETPQTPQAAQPAEVATASGPEPEAPAPAEGAPVETPQEGTTTEGPTLEANAPEGAPESAPRTVQEETAEAPETRTDDGSDTVFIKIDALDNYMQSLPPADQRTLREALGWRESNRVEATGEYFIPGEKYRAAVKQSKELNNAVGMDLRQGVQGVTLREQNSAMEKLRQLMSDPMESDEPRAVEAQKVREDLTKVLRQGGQSQELARANADLMSHYFFNLSRTLSMNDDGTVREDAPGPQALYEKLNIKSEKGKGVQQQAAVEDIAQTNSGVFMQYLLKPSDYDEDGSVRPDVVQEIKNELAIIRSEAEKNGTYLKAPNGNDSNLPAGVWEMVRTRRFREWFGNSQVLDENGEPKIVYHGTSNIFDSFDKTRVGSHFGLPATGRLGFYFTNDDALANDYAAHGYVMPVFLRINNPLVIEDTGWGSAVNQTDARESDLRRWAQEGEHDGIIVRSTDEELLSGEPDTVYVAFEPEQIKSVDNRGTFDAGENIFYQEVEYERRLNEDIRYWGTTIDTFLDNPKGINKGKNLTVLRQTPLALVLVGAKNRTLETKATTLRKMMLNPKKHQLSPDLVKQIPGALVEPVMVFQDTKEDNALVVLLNLKKDGRSLIVPVSLEVHRGNRPTIINLMRSAYDLDAREDNKGKGSFNEGWILDQINEEKLLYIDEEKAKGWGNEVSKNKKNLSEAQSARLTSLLQMSRSLSTLEADPQSGSLYSSIKTKADLVKARQAFGNTLYQSAWHGTPHRFDRFDLGAIGTGEGAQVHGWGLYFAQDKKVAQDYRDTLAWKSQRINDISPGEQVYSGKSLQDWYDEFGAKLDTLNPRSEAFTVAQNTYELLESVLLGDSPKSVYNEAVEDGGYSQQALKWFKKNIVDQETRSFGSLFEVDVPENDELLDENKAIKDQPAKVQEGLKKVLSSLTRDQKKEFAEVISPGDFDHSEVLKLRQRVLTFEHPEFIDAHFNTLIEDGDMYNPAVRNAYSTLERWGLTEDELNEVINESVRPQELAQELADKLKKKGPQLLAEARKDLARAEKEAAVQDDNNIKKYVENLFEDDIAGEAVDGEKFYEALSAALKNSQEIGARSSNPKAASLALNDAGIKGITYEGEQDGRCFVVFDDKAVSVIERYNQQINGQREQARGYIEFGENGESIIGLLKDADQSTFIHEMGHMMLGNLVAFGQAKDAAAQVKRDLQTALDFLGVRDASEITREHHEKFARTFELYLMTGKAPSSKLRQVFAKMKRWLLSIYHHARNLNTEINPEIQDLFDRMLAGPVEEDGGNTTLSELRDDTAATAARIEAIEKEAPSVIPRVVSAQWDSVGLDETNMPAWVTHELIDGMGDALAEGRPALENAIRKLGGIRYDSVVATWGEGEAKELRARDRSLFRKDGAAFDTLVAELEHEGIHVNDAQDLYDRLMAQEPKITKGLNVAITEETLPWLFYLMDDGEVRDYAASRQRLLNRELKALQDADDHTELRSRGPEIAKEQDLIREILDTIKKPPQQQKAEVSESDDSAFVGGDADLSFGPPQGDAVHESIPTQEAADRAAGLLRDDELISLKEADRRAWRRAQRESRRAFLAGRKLGVEQQREKAADLKARQKERAELKKEVQKIIRRIEKARGQKSIIWAVKQEIEALLKGYTLKNPSSQRMAQAQGLYTFLADNPDADFSMLSPQEQKLVDMLGTTMLPDMTIDELRALDAKVEEMRKRGRDAYERWQAEKKQRRVDMFSECLSALGKIPDTEGKVIRGPQDLRKEYKGVKGTLEKAKDWTYASTLGSHRLFDWIGNGKGLFKSAWTKYFVEAVNTAHDEYLRNANDRRERIEAVMQENGLTLRDLSRSRVVDGQQYTVDEMLSVYALLQNEKGAKALLFGNFKGLGDFAQSHAAHIVQALTAEERAVADAVLDDYDQSFDRLNKRFIEVYNEGMVKEEHYSPMKRLEYTSNEGVIDAEDAETLEGRSAAAGMLASLEKGFLHKRMEISEENQQPVDLGLLSIWNEQVTAQEHTAAFAQLAGDLSSVLHQRDEATGVSMAKAVRLTKGTEAWQSVTGYTNLVIMNEARAAHNVLNKLSSYFGRNMSMVYLAGSISVYLKQWMSLPRFVLSAGPQLLVACGEYLKDQVTPGSWGKKFLNSVYELDPQIKERIPNAFYKLTKIDPTTASEFSYLSEETIKKLMLLGAYQDRVTAAIGFKAVYDSNIKRGLSKKEAVQAAQRAVALTQQVPNLKDMPAFWRQSGLAKLMMIFSSNSVPLWGMTAYDLAQAIKRGDIPQSFRTIMALTVAALGTALVTTAPPSGDDDDTWWNWFMSAMTEQTITSLPVVGKEVFAAWDELINRNRRGSTYSALVTPFVKGTQGVKRMLSDDSDNVMPSGMTKFESGAWQAAEGLGLLFPGGLPVTMARRIRQMASSEDGWQAIQTLCAIRRSQQQATKKAVSW